MTRKIGDEEIADRLANLANAPLGIGDDAEFRISIAGAQDKTTLLHWKNAWHVPSRFHRQGSLAAARRHCRGHGSKLKKLPGLAPKLHVIDTKWKRISSRIDDRK